MRRLGTGVVLGMAAVLAVVAAAQEDAGGTPEDVLAVLQGLAHGDMTSHWNSGDFLLVRPARQEIEEAFGEHIVSVLPPGCGNMTLEGLPLDAARDLIGRLFEIHGYPLETDYALEAGAVEARLDGYDPKRKAGYKFVYGSFKPRAQGDPMRTDRPAERPEHALDAGEFRNLLRGGYRILLVPVDRFVSTHRDTFTPLFTCALDVLEFLNGIPDGPALAIEPLAFGVERTTPVPAPDETTFPEGEGFQEAGPAVFFVVKRRGTLRLRLDPAAAAQPTSNAPSLLVLRFYWIPPFGPEGYDFDGDSPRFTLRQGTGPEAVTIESGRPVIVLPPAFDPTRPFRLDVTVPPGQCHLGSAVHLFTAR